MKEATGSEAPALKRRKFLAGVWAVPWAGAGCRQAERFPEPPALSTTA